MTGSALALGGKSSVKSLVEWCLQPLRFEALGSPGFYVSWARPEVFVTALQTNLGTSGAQLSAYDVGAQVDFQLHVMHREPMMLSFGVARGYGAGGIGITEYMVSLQVL